MKGKLKRIISMILCLAMVLCIAACGDDGTATKKKKVIVKKKIIKKDDSSQTDTSSEDTSAYDDVLPGFDWGDTSPDEILSDSSEEEESSPYEVDLDYTEHSEVNYKIGMAFYHFEIGQWDAIYGDIAAEKDFMSYYRVHSLDELREIKKKGGMGWMLIGDPFDDAESTVIDDSWAESLDKTMQAFKKAGVWDSFAGFETEELCLRVTEDQYRILTKYLRDTYPDKRVFAVLSMYEVRGTAPSGFTVAPMSYGTYGYVTDIAFDWYTPEDYDTMKGAVDLMLENLGREKNVRVWFLPCCYQFSGGGLQPTGSSTEEHMLKQLEVCYELLLEQENPGGLYCYTWKTFSDNNGMERLFDPDIFGDMYTRLRDRVIEVGKELAANPYRYTRTYN